MFNVGWWSQSSTIKNETTRQQRPNKQKKTQQTKERRKAKRHSIRVVPGFTGFPTRLLGFFFTEFSIGCDLKRCLWIFLCRRHWSLVVFFYRVFTEFWDLVRNRFFHTLGAFSLIFRVFCGFLLDCIGFYWVLQGFTGFYWVLLGFTGFHYVFNEFYLVFHRFFIVWARFPWYRGIFVAFYWITLGFTGLYWVLLGFPGFH